MAAVSAEAVEYLARQLAGRAQHQHAAGLALRPPPTCEQMMQDRQRERRGFAGAGLRNPDHVAARENGGEGVRPERRGGGGIFFRGRRRGRVGGGGNMKKGRRTKNSNVRKNVRPNRTEP